MSYLNFSWIVFMMGLVGMIWNKKDMLLMMFCIELVFFSMGLNFVFLSNYTFQPMGQMYCLLMVTVAAAETAMGLGLLMMILRLSNKMSYESLMTLSG